VRCDWSVDVVCVVLCQVMKKLMNIQTEFWLRYVNVDDDDDDGDDDNGENMEPPADDEG